MTPKRPDATCLIALRRQSPFASGCSGGSSPPSPVLVRPPMRFIAMASVSCASALIEPKDIAPVAKRLTIASTGSTSSSGIGPLPTRRLELSRPRSVASSWLWSSTAFEYSLKISYCPLRVACCSLNTVSGLNRWYSPSRRHWYSPPGSSASSLTGRVG